MSKRTAIVRVEFADGGEVFSGCCYPVIFEYGKHWVGPSLGMCLNREEVRKEADLLQDAIAHGFEPSPELGGLDWYEFFPWEEPEVNEYAPGFYCENGAEPDDYPDDGQPDEQKEWEDFEGPQDLNTDGEFGEGLD